MNYLAHLLLSGDDPDMMLGGWLGDFVKGPLPLKVADSASPWPAAVERGILLHRRIDAYCDQHPVVRQSIARLGPDMRRVGGIAIDLCYDHFLARRWNDFHTLPLNHYAEQVYHLLNSHHPQMPPAAQRFNQRAQQHRLLESYRRFNTLEGVLARIAERFSRPTPLAASYLRLQADYQLLSDDFDRVFPELLEFARVQWHK